MNELFETNVVKNLFITNISCVVIASIIYPVFTLSRGFLAGFVMLGFYSIILLLSFITGTIITLNNDEKLKNVLIATSPQYFASLMLFLINLTTLSALVGFVGLMCIIASTTLIGIGIGKLFNKFKK